MAEVTDAEKYGYGTIAICIVSMLGLLGIIILPCWKKAFYNKLLVILTGLAISTLFCDVVLHILPHIVEGEHAHEEVEGEVVITVSDVTVRCALVVIALYLFWLFEVLISKFLGVHQGSGHGHSHTHGGNVNEIQPVSNSNTQSGDVATTQQHNDGSVENQVENKSDAVKDARSPNSCLLFLKSIQPAAWMLIISDFIHNFCDGLAIGASFSESISLGVATSIAVVCHEIPHELGDYAVYIQFGFKHWQAVLINFGTTLSCFIGFYIGASIPPDSGAAAWILSITAGMFIYIALVDLMPQLSFMESNKWNWPLFVFVNLAFVLGFAIMFLLAVFEEHIKI